MARRAFLCGINRYERFSALRGCENDVTNLRFVLKEFYGFSNADIRLLVDDRATKAAIEDRLAWLVDGAKAGDLLVLHFSGHGSQVRDRGEQDELSDSLDEILCPFDMNWDDCFVTDDFLAQRLQAPPGVAIEVLLDCCCSGDAQTELGLPTVATPAGDDRRPRFLQAPADIVSRHEGESLPKKRLFLSRGTTERTPLSLWSACASNQTAADANIGGVFTGAFTFHFCRIIRETAGKLSRAELLQRVRFALASNGFSQVPELAVPASLSDKGLFQL